MYDSLNLQRVFVGRTLAIAGAVVAFALLLASL